MVSYVDRTFFLWAVARARRRLRARLSRSAATWRPALTGLLWGGAVRVFVLHHVTYSINSLCHIFGRQPFETKDESRNLAWLAAAHDGRGLAQQPPRLSDLGCARPGPLAVRSLGLVIAGLEKTGLAWDVVRIAPERQAAKALA